MANKPKGFIVAAEKRPSGTPYWLVRGSRDGRQIRREFNNRDDAHGFAEQQTSELNGTTATQSRLLTHLTAEQLHGAEAAIQQLAREFPGQSLLDLVDYYRQLSPVMTTTDAAHFGSAFNSLKKKYPDATLPEVCAWFTQHFRPAKSAVTLKIALEHYLADVLRRKNTGSLSEWQFVSVGFAMNRLEKYFGPEEPIANLTTFRLKEYLHATIKAKDGSSQYSNKTWSNARGYLTTFFKFCQQESWLDQNPAKGLKNFTRKDFRRPTPCILSLKQARDLMKHVEDLAGGRMVPFFVLTLFCGIRPTFKFAEIARITPQHFNLATAELSLRAEDTKTGRPRTVRLQPNVLRWLKAYPIEKHPIIAKNFRKIYFKIRKDFQLGFDVLRHSYCSYLIGQYRSVGDAALQAGNSESVMWGSYLNLVASADAKAFWQIQPRRKVAVA